MNKILPDKKRQFYLFGNWKMYGLRNQLDELSNLKDLLPASDNIHYALFLPFTLLSEAIAITAQSSLRIGAQNCHHQPFGPFTGEISAPMLKDMGVTYVLLGHSERRLTQHEHTPLIGQKLRSAQENGLYSVVCIGETAEDRTNGRTISVLSRQIEGALIKGTLAERLMIAYEPVWAIGTGQIPDAETLTKNCRIIRDLLEKKLGPIGLFVPLLYGGSVTSVNAEYFASISQLDGLLIGSASLETDKFIAIASAVTLR